MTLAEDEIHPVSEYLDLTDTDLELHGWRQHKRSDGQEFTIVVKIEPGLNIGKAFSKGEGLLAIHQVRDSDGELRPGWHIDPLIKSRGWAGDIMVIPADAMTDHDSLIVLERI